MSEPFFSIIIPTYNRLGMLEAALQSVQRQTFTDYECIVIDDGSSDGTPDFLMALQDGTQVIQQPHLGPGAARNAGIAAASGSYIAFLDSDDAWFSWTLQVYHQAISTSANPAFLTGTACDWEAAGRSTFSESKITVFADLLHACQGDMPPVSGTPSICLRRDVLQASGGFAAHHMNAEDVDLWLRLADAPGFVQIHSPSVFAQRRHDGNVSLALEPGITGAQHLITQELAGRYPGGAAFAPQRRRIIAANARSIIFEALRQGRLAAAWDLFRRTFAWQMRFQRYKFVTAFPFLFLRASFWSVTKHSL